MFFVLLISFDLYYITYIFLELLCQLYQLKHTKTLLIHLFHFRYIICIISFDIYYIDYLHYLIYINSLSIHSNCNKWYNAQNWYNRTYYMSHSHVAMCLQPHWPSLHIAGPARSPQIDKSHPASVPGTLPEVSGRARKKIAHAVQNGSGVTNRKGLGGKLIAANPLYTIVLCMTKHQTVIKSNMTLVSGWFLEFQCL